MPKNETKYQKSNDDITKQVQSIKCFALDMDGTIYLGTTWIDGAMDFLSAIENSGREYFFLTNNSSKDPVSYVEKLAKMGLVVTRDKIITSADATIAYLKKEYAGKKVYLLGNSLLKRQFEEEGFELIDDDRELAAAFAAGENVNKPIPGVVVTAFDTELDYNKMCVVCDYIRGGLPYISTHPDYNCPTEKGFIPDSGAIHAFIEASTGRKPDKVIGKPNAGIMEYLLDKTGYERAEVAMVGDRLYTDVAAGVNNGMTGILVLSGEATMDDVAKSEVEPDLIFDSVKNIIEHLS